MCAEAPLITWIVIVDKSHFVCRVILIACLFINNTGYADVNNSITLVDELLLTHPGQDGLYVLDTGEESLMTRAWLAEKAVNSIDVQYFIWSSDNIGILAAEALLSAAERGVTVRVIVDDLLVDASEQTLIALAAHPNVQIRIYNPKHSVGTSIFGRLKNVLTDFHGINQRMHDKTFMVDGKVAITGGRNMADEYYDYNHQYNFRDRDILVMGDVVKNMEVSFEKFWTSELSIPVEDLLRDADELTNDEVKYHHDWLHQHARDPENYLPEVRRVIEHLHEDFEALIDSVIWSNATFISDEPGKNIENNYSGGGQTTQALIQLVEQAKYSVTIQSPYLVMPDGALAKFKSLTGQGVKVNINTNSLASTDNLLAYSGYSKQREHLLSAGINITEFKPYPEIQQQIMHRYDVKRDALPIFAIHAKTMVIDSEYVFIGTFNLDPRSANLNTEVGILVKNPQLAKQVETAIQLDASQENSWNALKDEPEQYASLFKKIQLFFLKLLPLEPVL